MALAPQQIDLRYSGHTVSLKTNETSLGWNWTALVGSRYALKGEQGVYESPTLALSCRRQQIRRIIDLDTDGRGRPALRTHAASDVAPRSQTRCIASYSAKASARIHPTSSPSMRHKKSVPRSTTTVQRLPGRSPSHLSNTTVPLLLQSLDVGNQGIDHGRWFAVGALGAPDAPHRG